MSFNKTSEEYKGIYGEYTITFSIEQEQGGLAEITVMYKKKDESDWHVLLSAGDPNFIDVMSIALLDINSKLRKMMGGNLNE